MAPLGESVARLHRLNAIGPVQRKADVSEVRMRTLALCMSLIRAIRSWQMAAERVARGILDGHWRRAAHKGPGRV